MSDVANTIYRQLGGNKFRVMTGAKMMVSMIMVSVCELVVTRPMLTLWKSV